MTLRAVLLACLIPAGCYDPKDPNVPPIDPKPDDWPGSGEVVEVFPDDSPQAASSPCGQLCAHLRDVPCPEGKDSRCYRGCVHRAALATFPMSCLRTAQTPEKVRACGPAVRCMP